MKRLTLYLVILIPATSVVMGMVSLYFAFSDPDPVVRLQDPPLNKTSWQDRVPADNDGDASPVEQPAPVQP